MRNDDIHTAEASSLRQLLLNEARLLLPLSLLLRLRLPISTTSSPASRPGRHTAGTSGCCCCCCCVCIDPGPVVLLLLAL